MATTRARQLEKLAMSLPQENQRMAQGQQQARQIQLQEQVRQASPTGGPAMAQQMGAQQAQQAGQIQQQAAANTQQQQQAVAQMGLADKARQQRQTGFEQQLTLSEKQREIADKLSSIDINLKKTLLDDQLEFKRDAAGQTLLNERQLADWAVTKAQSAEEFAEYAQSAQQVYEREIQLLEAAHREISKTLQQNFIKKGVPLDQELRKKLATQKQQLNLEIQKKQNKAANKAAQYKAAGTVAGTVAGGVIGSIIPGVGTLAGATIGATIGGGLGTMAGSL